MILEYTKTEVLEDLKGNFSKHKKHYQNNNKDYFAKYLGKSQGLQSSKIECDDFELDFSDDYNISDYKNIKILYLALIDLPLSIAADERLWAGLAHGQFWDYIYYRRKVEIKSGNEQDIKNSFFFTRGTKRSAHINCLSRLWWAGHLTYDVSEENPFELTKLLCKGAFASTIMLLSSSNFTANKEICLGLLKGIKNLEDYGVAIKREHFVEATKYLNSMGSITILDSLTKHDVEKIIDNFFVEKFGSLNLNVI
jgi:hypothetical protein